MGVVQDNQGRQSRKCKTQSWKYLLENDSEPCPSRKGIKYALIPLEQRKLMVEEILKTGCSIKSAAKMFGINFSTAKAIMQIYRREGRIGKKDRRDKKRRRKTNKSIKKQKKAPIQMKKKKESGEVFEDEGKFRKVSRTPLLTNSEPVFEVKQEEIENPQEVLNNRNDLQSTTSKIEIALNSQIAQQEVQYLQQQMIQKAQFLHQVMAFYNPSQIKQLVYFMNPHLMMQMAGVNFGNNQQYLQIEGSHTIS